MVSKINSVGLFGLHSYMVEVEADIESGKFRFDLVGLPDTAVQESRERVLSAIKNSARVCPNEHITINLAPADVRKEGSVYDLPIYIAILCCMRRLRGELGDAAFIGELSLSGDVRPVTGVLPMVIEAKKAGLSRIFVPAANAAEGAVVEGITVYPVAHVRQLLAFLEGTPVPEDLEPLQPTSSYVFNGADPFAGVLDFADVKGQTSAQRALEVAAAGGHNILMSGPPGSRKSMLAKRLPTILPDMTFEEALETTKIYSVAGALDGEQGLVTRRPFRSPHHTVSQMGLSGGGVIPRPGEISLAHNGVLFLDELPEFSRNALESMRQPIEDGKITISRAAGALTYPCEIMLVAAMNPCPCGYLGHPTKPCTCSPQAAQRYLARVSGPLLDRIDIQIEVPPVDFAALSDRSKREETSAVIKARVNAARRIQQERFRGGKTTCNAKMSAAEIERYCELDAAGKALVQKIFDSLGLSARAYTKILKLSRTIADVEGSERILPQHITEAIRYRNLDRRIFQNGGSV